MYTMRILIADDESVACELLGAIVRDLGHEAHTVSRARDVLPAIDARWYDALFLDINMPEISGIDIIKQLKEKNCPVRIIVITAMDNEVARQYIEELGVDGYIIKPYKIDYLKNAIENVLQKKGMR